VLGAVKSAIIFISGMHYNVSKNLNSDRSNIHRTSHIAHRVVCDMRCAMVRVCGMRLYTAERLRLLALCLKRTYGVALAGSIAGPTRVG